MAYYEQDAGFRSWERFRRRVDYPKLYPTEPKIEDPELYPTEPNENEDY